jgi:hypothetical protein
MIDYKKSSSELDASAAKAENKKNNPVADVVRLLFY